ncbi:MAG: M18 family aminopeptidase [Planctomycetes bacterium]|nr:M18 family aminopeptidase [Planctomycetota bacterium]
MDATALCRFIDASPSPAHAAATLVGQLVAAGFSELSLTQPEWRLAPGRFLVRRGASVVAFVVRGAKPTRFALVGAHTDSPHLRLKPRAAFQSEGCCQLGVEVYGGALLNSWLDRDLGLAGTVHASDGSERLIRIDRPLARVPQLAIHLDRKVTEDGLKLNAQTQLAPIWALATEGTDAAAAFADLLAAASGIAATDIAAHDLSLYDLTPSAIGGAGGEFVFAPRLDNLASCHAGAMALIAATDGEPSSVAVLACHDHEEVGSTSASGADGSLLGTALERIALGLGQSRAEHLAALASSLMISADMAHAVHPNYADRHEPRHKPQLGKGPVLKNNHNQRYATSAASAAAVRALAARARVPLQDFVTRTDLGCGTTIGPISAARLGICVADVGNPMLSMHSARECAATADHPPYIALLREHLKG